jgi:hypothetical protein
MLIFTKSCGSDNAVLDAFPVPVSRALPGSPSIEKCLTDLSIQHIQRPFIYLINMTRVGDIRRWIVLGIVPSPISKLWLAVVLSLLLSSFQISRSHVSDVMTSKSRLAGLVETDRAYQNKLDASNKEPFIWNVASSIDRRRIFRPFLPMLYSISKLVSMM